MMEKELAVVHFLTKKFEILLGKLRKNSRDIRHYIFQYFYLYILSLKPTSSYLAHVTGNKIISKDTESRSKALGIYVLIQ
jgi:hypothetical protein